MFAEHPTSSVQHKFQHPQGLVLVRELSGSNEHCPVCYEYDLNDKRPLCLSCGHSICATCVPELEKCPICLTQIPSDQKFPINYALETLLFQKDVVERIADLDELFTEEQKLDAIGDQKSEPCEECGLKDSSQYCSDCDIIYCDDCGTVAVPTQDLPVQLPEDVDFDKSGKWSRKNADPHNVTPFIRQPGGGGTIASSIRLKGEWLNQLPSHQEVKIEEADRPLSSSLSNSSLDSMGSVLSCNICSSDYEDENDGEIPDPCLYLSKYQDLWLNDYESQKLVFSEDLLYGQGPIDFQFVAPLSDMTGF